MAAVDVLEGQDVPAESHPWEVQPNPQFDYIEDDDWLAKGITTVDELNGLTLPLLTQLREFEFFRFFAVDLLSSCSYMPTHDEPCGLDACDIEPAEDVPQRMIDRDENEYEFELDSWARWDMPSDYSEYYDLKEHPEGSTGYDGSRIWRFIHQKICFQLGLDEPVNRWKRDYNRAISGMHASVSASIVGAIAKTDEAEALVQYRRRLRDEPGAISNLYFTYMLSLCAVKDAAERLENCEYLGEGAEVRPIVKELIRGTTLAADPAVQQAAFHLREHASTPACSAWKARLRTRDLLRVMNCLECNLCRLHGKVTALGLAATLQCLLGFTGRGEEGCNRDSDPYSLHRVEVAALIATCAKFGDSIATVQQMRALDAAGGEDS